MANPNRQDPAQVPADGPPVPNQGGVTAPKVNTPRPVPPPPAVRSRKDSIVRPVAPGGAANYAAPPPPPPPPGGAQPTGATAPGSRAAQAAQAPGLQKQSGVPGLETTAQLPQPEIETKIKAPDGSTYTAKGPPGSEAAAQAQEQTQEIQERKSRESAPSPVNGVPMRTYEAVTSPDNAPPGASAQAREVWTRESERQLTEFGDYPGKGDPDAPAPPVRPFGRSFNPFAGSFTGRKTRGPDPWKSLGIDMEKYKQDYLSGRSNNG